jgi:SAM-dependent methyltransferase
MKNNLPFLCPLCKHGEIIVNEKNFTCNNNSCKNIFLNISGKPVLIDYNKSVIDKNNLLLTDGNSFVYRINNSLLLLLKKLFFGDGYVTKKNIKNITNKIINKNNFKILIVGGGTIGSGLKELYKDYYNNIFSFDIYNSPNIDFIADAHDIPIQSSTFDCIIIQAVLEHVIDPKTVLDECFRILKIDGLIYAETPFMQQVHEGPYDFTRYTDSGHRSLFRKFLLIDSGYVAGSGTSLMWSLGYFFSGIFRTYKAGKFIRLCFFWLRYFDHFIPKKFNLDGASGVFFLGQKKKNYIDTDNKQIIDYYKGAQ